MSKEWHYFINASGLTVEVDRVTAEKLILDANFREATAEEIAAYQFAHRPKPKKDIVDVYFETSDVGGMRTDGYSQSTPWLERELVRHKVFLNREYAGQKVGLAYGYPYHLERMKTPIRILYTMFESSAIPPEWVEQLKLADLILVPSTFCQKAFKARGVETQVVPLGYDQATFRHIARSTIKPDPFTFLMYDAFNERKGWRDLFEAFKETFGDDPTVRLVLKTVRNPSIPILKSEYPNIDVIKENLPPDKLAALLGEADCFVFPTHGEGFGLPPLEAAATGLPVIVPFASGMSEYTDKEYFIKVKHSENFAPLFDKWKKDVGHMIQVDRKDLGRVMLETAKRPIADLRALGQLASEHVRNTYPIERTGNILAGIIKDKQTKRVTIEATAPKRPGVKSIAVLMDQINFYSGGRYLNWMQGMMLTEAGYDVTIYTTMQPPFAEDFKEYLQPKIEIVPNLLELDVKADIYFGSPEPGTLAAARLAQKYDKPCIVQMFDPPQLLEANDRSVVNETQRDHIFRRWLEENKLKDLTMLTLTEDAKRYYVDWYSIGKESVVCLYPSVNSKLLDSFFSQTPRENWVVAINRNHPRKAWDELFAAYAPYADSYHLHIITHTENGMAKLMDEAGINKSRVTIHIQMPDLEKFYYITRAKAVLSASHFEGFGMWAIEAASLGTPCVAYELPSMLEIKPKLPQLYLAKFGNTGDLSGKLGEALKDTKHIPVHDFSFSRIRDRFDAIVRAVSTGKKAIDVDATPTYESDSAPPKSEGEPALPNVRFIETRPNGAIIEQHSTYPKFDKKINVVTMVLNEQKFIRPFLQSLLKRPEIGSITLVEGADQRYPNANKNGLSSDKTADRLRYMAKRQQATVNDRPILWHRMGWVAGKEELKNKGLELADENYPDAEWTLFLDVDEIFDDENWAKLMQATQDNPETGVIFFRYLHFWKRPDTIAVGGQWESHPLRLFRNVKGKVWRVGFHASEPCDQDGTKITDQFGMVKLKDVFVHHYGGMKDASDIKDKLEFYRRRDTGLTVTDTWSKWKPGDPTQWTHGNGTHKKYNGKHPIEVRDIIK